MVIVATQLAKLCQLTLNTLLPRNHTGLPFVFDPNIRSIAVIAPFFIGDTVLATVLLQNLAKQCSPQTRIYTISPAHHRNLLETLPRITAHFETPKTMEEKSALLRRLHCDGVFILRYSLPWGLAMVEAGVRYRVGFDLERFGLHKMQKWAGILTHPIPSGSFDSPVHQVQLYKAMLTGLGLQWDDAVTPKINVTEKDYDHVQGLLSGIHGPRIIIHVSAGSPGKRWPQAYWAELIEALHKEYQASFIAVGTQADNGLYEELEGLTGIPFYNLCGKTTLRQSAVLCQFSDLVVTLDTALAHIAAAVEAPRLVVIYGPTNFEQWRPVASPQTQLEQVSLNIGCRPCLTRTCYHRSCLQYLNPERVLHHIQRTMKTYSQEDQAIWFKTDPAVTKQKSHGRGILRLCPKPSKHRGKDTGT